jgi:hypothetical protein
MCSDSPKHLASTPPAGKDKQQAVTGQACKSRDHSTIQILGQVLAVTNSPIDNRCRHKYIHTRTFTMHALALKPSVPRLLPTD